MKLMIALSVSAATSALSVAARADLRVCNHTSYTTWTTLASAPQFCPTNCSPPSLCNDVYGWYQAAPNQCVTAVNGCLNWGGFGPMTWFDYYADDSNGDYWAGGNGSFCTGYDAHCESEPNGAISCSTSDDDNTVFGYRGQSIGAGCDFTLNLTP